MYHMIIVWLIKYAENAFQVVINYLRLILGKF